MILDKVEDAIKTALVDAGYTDTIRTFWNDDEAGEDEEAGEDDEAGEDEEAKVLPVIVIVASPSTYENNLKSFQLVPVLITCLTHTADDKKRQVLKSMFSKVMEVVEDNALTHDDINIKSIMNNQGGTSFIDEREQGVNLNIEVRVSTCY